MMNFLMDDAESIGRNFQLLIKQHKKLQGENKLMRDVLEPMPELLEALLSGFATTKEKLILTKEVADCFYDQVEALEKRTVEALKNIGGD